MIPAHNAAATIADQLSALGCQTYAGAVEIIVADNGSDDGTGNLVRRLSADIPHITVVDASGTAGSAYARNVGVAAASGTSIAFCDADDTVEAGWLDALVQRLTEAPLVAGQYQLESPDDTVWAPARTREPYLGFLPYADTCSMAVDRAVFDSVGGFDEGLLRASDVDFSWRVQLAGHLLTHAPSALVRKRAPATRRARLQQAYAWARAEPALYARHRTQGMPASTIGSALRDTAVVVLTTPLVWRSEQRATWRRLAPLHAARLVGSARARCWFP